MEWSCRVSTYERGIDASTASSTLTGVANAATACGRRPDDRLGHLLLGAAVVDRDRRRFVGEGGHGRVALDHDVCLDQVVGALRQVCQVEQALAVRRHEGANEDERSDLARDGRPAACVTTAPPML